MVNAEPLSMIVLFAVRVLFLKVMSVEPYNDTMIFQWDN